MKRIKNFESYINDSDITGLHDQMNTLIQQVNDLVCKHKKINKCNLAGPKEAIDRLKGIKTAEAKVLLNDIINLQNEIDELEEIDSDLYYNSSLYNDFADL